MAVSDIRRTSGISTARGLAIYHKELFSGTYAGLDRRTQHQICRQWHLLSRARNISHAAPHALLDDSCSAPGQSTHIWTWTKWWWSRPGS